MFTCLATVLAVAAATANAQVYYLPADAQPNAQQGVQQIPFQIVQPNYRPLDVLPTAPVYGYIPPSPRAPACPQGYTCCGTFKHFDPQGVKRCCGDRAFTPALQSCANGEIVSIVQAQPPPPTTPLPVYVQRVELVCEGVKWQVPYPNYRCCGPSVYNVANEQCTANGVAPSGLIQSAPQSQNPPNVMFPVQPVPAPTTAAPPQPTTKLLICQGRRYSVPHSVSQFYACCGFQAYFWLTERCANGQISPSRPSTTTTSATPIAVPLLVVCDTTQHWVSSEDRPYIGCCGADTYDIRVDTCRQPFRPSGNGFPQPAPAPAGNCPSGFICCENYPAVENTGNALQCCPGVGPYDPQSSSCPSANGTQKK